MVKKESELTAAEREFLETKTFKNKLQTEKKQIQETFDTAVKEDKLKKFKGKIPDNSSYDYGNMWKRLNILAEDTIKLKAEKEFEINEHKKTRAIAKAELGELDFDTLHKKITPLSANLEVNLKKIIEEENNIYQSKLQNLDNIKPNTRMHQGWEYSTGKKGNQAVARVLGIIATNSSDIVDEDIVNNLMGSKKGKVDVSELLIKKFVKNPEVLKKLHKVHFSSQIATEYVSQILEEVNKYNTNPKTIVADIKSAIGKNIDSLQAAIDITDEAKDYLTFTLLEAQEIVTGLGKKGLNQKNLFAYQQEILSLRKQGILGDAYGLIHNISDPSNKNIAYAILSDHYGYPSEEPILTADNQVNKKYYGEPINRVIDKQVTRIDVLKAQLSYVDETLLNVKNSNVAINVDSLEINLTRLAANKPLPLTKLQIQKAISAIDTRVSTALTEAKKTTALKHALTFKIGIASGLRSAELVDLRFEDIDLEKNTIYVRQGKGGRSRQAYITDKNEYGLTDTYNEYKKKLKNTGNRDFLFPGSGGKAKQSTGAFRTFIASIAEELDIPKKDLAPHRLRHYVGTKIAVEGNINTAQEVLGHASPNTTEIYVHEVDTDLISTKNPEKFVIDQDGLFVDPEKLTGNAEEQLKIIKQNIQKEILEIQETATDFVVQEKQVVKQRKTTGSFKFKVWSNLNIDVKNVDLKDKVINTRTLSGTKKFVDTPGAVNRQTVGIERNPFFQAVVNGVDNSERLGNINFKLFGPQTDNIDIFADPDNYTSSVGLDKEIADINLSKPLPKPYNSVEDLPININIKYIPSNVKTGVPIINRKKKRFKRLTKEQRRLLIENIKKGTKYSAFGAVVSSLFSKVAQALPAGKQVKGAVTSTKLLAKKLADPTIDVGIEYLMYDPAQGEKLLLDYKRDEEGKIKGGRSIAFLDNIQFEGFELEQTTDPEQAKVNLDKLSGEEFVKFAGTDINKKLGVEETSFDPNKPLDKTIYGAAGKQTLLNPDQEEFRGQIEKSTTPLVAQAYSDAQSNYERELLNKINKIDPNFNSNNVKPIEDKDVLNPDMTIEQMMIDKKLREKNQQENIEGVLAEDRLSEIQEARFNKIDESINTIENTEIDIDKELGPEVRTNNQMAGLGLTSQPQGEEDATIR
jgi:integrase